MLDWDIFFFIQLPTLMIGFTLGAVFLSQLYKSKYLLLHKDMIVSIRKTKTDIEDTELN